MKPTKNLVAPTFRRSGKISLVVTATSSTPVPTGTPPHPLAHGYNACTRRHSARVSTRIRPHTDVHTFARTSLHIHTHTFCPCTYSARVPVHASVHSHRSLRTLHTTRPTRKRTGTYSIKGTHVHTRGPDTHTLVGTYFEVSFTRHSGVHITLSQGVGNLVT